METSAASADQTAAWQVAGLRAFRADVLSVAMIFIISLTTYILSPVTTSTDSAWTFHLAASLLREHNVDLNEYGALLGPGKLDYRMREVRGQIYSYYPVATPLLVTPAVWLIDQVYPLFYPTDFYTYLETHAPNSRTAKMEKILASGFAALAAVVMYCIARRELSLGRSLLAAGIFAFATSMWSTASRALWQHGPSALFLAGAIYLLFLARKRPRLLFWLGLVLGYSYLIRPTNSLAVALIGLYVLLNESKHVGLYVAGLAAIFVPYLAQNWMTYGNLFPPYSYQLFERLASPGTFFEGLAGTLISPARGLFIFSSIFLFSIYGAFLRLRGKLSLANPDLFLAAIVLFHWIIISMFEDWGGAWSIGPRYFVDVIPLLIYFLIPVLRPSALPYAGLRYAFAATVVFSVLIQFHCSTSIYPFMWNGKPRALVSAPARKWDWGDLQFLRGFCPSNPLEGRAPACWFDKND